MNMEFKRKLPTPQTIRDMYPVSPELARQKQANDRAVRDVLTGEDNRLMLLIGPCSADREDAVLDYVTRLRGLQEKVKDKILLVPRVYSNKPRTTGDGYKGMLHQPDPNGDPDILKGLIATRKMHIKVLEQTGFSGADELLYPENCLYLSDILSYVAIGARSVEDQQHRLISSGLDIPVGMKNPTSGDLTVMMNSIKAAQHGHTFLLSQWEVRSKGNPLAHAILRGSVNKCGRALPNYHYEDLSQLCELYGKSGLENPAVIIDTNHSNSGKQWDQQARIAKEVLHSTRHSGDIHRMVSDPLKVLGDHQQVHGVFCVVLGVPDGENELFPDAGKVVVHHVIIGHHFPCFLFVLAHEGVNGLRDHGDGRLGHVGKVPDVLSRL